MLEGKARRCRQLRAVQRTFLAWEGDLPQINVTVTGCKAPPSICCSSTFHLPQMLEIIVSLVVLDCSNYYPSHSFLPSYPSFPTGSNSRPLPPSHSSLLLSPNSFFSTPSTSSLLPSSSDRPLLLPSGEDQVCKLKSNLTLSSSLPGA